MYRGWSEFFQVFFVEARAVTFVPAKTVLRIFFIALPHYCITRDLRDYRGRSDGDALGITSYDALDRALRSKLHPSIDNNIIGRDIEVTDGHLHGLQGSLVYIYFVYRLLVDNAYADDRFPKYLFVSALSLLLGKLLRIVYLRSKAETLAYNCARDNRSCERAPPRFVNTSDQRVPGTI